MDNWSCLESCTEPFGFSRKDKYSINRSCRSSLQAGRMFRGGMGVSCHQNLRLVSLLSTQASARAELRTHSCDGERELLKYWTGPSPRQGYLGHQGQGSLPLWWGMLLTPPLCSCLFQKLYSSPTKCLPVSYSTAPTAAKWQMTILWCGVCFAADGVNRYPEQVRREGKGKGWDRSSAGAGILPGGERYTCDSVGRGRGI